MKAKAIPTMRIKHHVAIVSDHPIRSEIRAMPYVEIAAPIYTQLLQTPLTVADLPMQANLPGKQEMSKKLTPCIAPQISAVKSKEITPNTLPSICTKKARGIAHSNAPPKRIAAPITSLLNVLRLCNAVTTEMLMIEKIGSIIDKSVDSDTSLLNASE